MHVWRSYCRAVNPKICCCHNFLAEPGEAETQVVSVSCAYPGPAAAGGLPGFWGAAAAGADLPAVIPHDRWAIEQHYSPDVAGGQGVHGSSEQHHMQMSTHAWYH